ncbi:MAG TPA: hypothetical protein VHG28_24635 [Longimicrobiaceae bacterium]|nr:hypothetical protein [Longimicrobiaceae bacterium]
MEYAHDPFLFPLIREHVSRWERTGLTPEQERWFHRVSLALVALFLAAWVYVVYVRLTQPVPTDPAGTLTPVLGPSRPSALGDPNAPPTVGERITRNPLNPGADPLAPTITAALLERTARDYAARLPREIRGLSGKVYVQIVEPGETPELPRATTGELAFAAGERIVGNAGNTGIWEVVLRSGNLTREVPNLAVVRLVPMSAKRDGRIGRYRIGNWPCEVGSCPANPIYATPPGMIEVTPQNKEMFLSEHIQLKDFITKLQENVWPKYVVVDPQLLDKIELVVQELEAMGHPVDNLFAVSGFRSPWYNANGGTTAGRGQLSRHMYGDAMDIAVDNDRNGIMDDLNRDGRINLSDARIIGRAVDRVEQKYPSLVGGMHYYPPTGGHRGMVHIDTRGNRARW